MDYCEKIFELKRWPTREVKVGSIGVGGNNPIRIQSMTTSNTRDVQGTIDQILRLADAGAEIVRITVQGKKEAEAAELIKNGLLQKNCNVPIVADIHFYPKAAFLVADFVEKIRINPGNFLDRRAVFKQIIYDDERYAEEIKRLEEGFLPFVEKCKRLNRAIRIGTNHGSLSDRIMNRFGDTPRGMVESALEFTRICRMIDFHDIIFSMKASNALVMIEAYRLLVKEMKKLNWNYPLHLGVTEAGGGDEGRIKSSVGIGSLLLDGLGDTIRVSLTEDPWYEIPPCLELKKMAEQRQGQGVLPFIETRRGSKRPFERGSVFVELTDDEIQDPDFFSSLGCFFVLNRLNRKDRSCDGVVIGDVSVSSMEKIEILKKAGIQVLKKEDPCLVELKAPYLHFGRSYFEKHFNDPFPFIFRLNLDDDYLYKISAELGALLSDGIGEGVCFGGTLPLGKRVEYAFQLLQACRLKMTKTEYIACPGCGRTLFNLQEVTKKIEEKTSHLKGVKIAVMGCIVNGPGEMADADFGYVGSSREKIDLYVGKECIKRNIPEKLAVDELIALIKEEGMWVSP